MDLASLLEIIGYARHDHEAMPRKDLTRCLLKIFKQSFDPPEMGFLALKKLNPDDFVYEHTEETSFEYIIFFTNKQTKEITQIDYLWWCMD